MKITKLTNKKDYTYIIKFKQNKYKIKHNKAFVPNAYFDFTPKMISFFTYNSFFLQLLNSTNINLLGIKKQQTKKHCNIFA